MPLEQGYNLSKKKKREKSQPADEDRTLPPVGTESSNLPRIYTSQTPRSPKTTTYAYHGLLILT